MRNVEELGALEEEVIRVEQGTNTGVTMGTGSKGESLEICA